MDAVKANISVEIQAVTFSYSTFYMRQTTMLLGLLIFSFSGYGQEARADRYDCDTVLYFLKPRGELMQYIESPCPTDTRCIDEIQKAKLMVESGRIEFLYPLGISIVKLRQEAQLRQLCRSMGLFFNYELQYCIVSAGRLNGCYGLYMVKIIAQRFGKDFKQNLLNKADSLFAASYPTIDYYQCDKKPRIEGKSTQGSQYMTAIVSHEVYERLQNRRTGSYPKVDIAFYIDSLGVPSDYSVWNFSFCDDVCDSVLKADLAEIAIKHVSQYKQWLPGKLLGRKVRSRYVTTVSFKKPK